jgi:SAM-dependent methyltransferase
VIDPARAKFDVASSEPDGEEEWEMDWRIKARLQAALSVLPGGEHLNHLFQRWATGTYPRDDRGFLGVLETTREHCDRLAPWLDKPLAEASFYEFGPGWDLLGPLACWSLGVDHQVLVDIRPLARRALVNRAIEQFGRVSVPFPLTRRPAGPLPAGRDFHRALRERYGIDYRAPGDARATDLPTGSIDCITSTNALNHIPTEEVRAILNECRRLLAPSGAASFRIDYQDNYAYFDPRISVYNFLRYPERAWGRYSPPLHYQNRLRHRDFMSLFEAANLEAVAVTTGEASEAELSLLRNLKIDGQFQGYTLPELAVRSAWVTLRARWTPPKSGFMQEGDTEGRRLAGRDSGIRRTGQREGKQRASLPA